MALKRPAAASAPKEAKKPRGNKLDFSPVVNALDEATFLEPRVVTMLKEMAPCALGVYKDQRHEFLNRSVEMIGKTLSEIEAAIVKSIDETQAIVSGADAEKAAHEASVDGAEAVLAQRSEETREKREALAESAATLKGAQESVHAAEAAERTGNADLDTASERKATIEGVIASLGEFREAPAMKSKVNALLKGLKPFNLDESLINTLALPLMKKPEDRMGFDILVVQNLEGICASKRAELEATLASGEPAKAARAADVASAKAAREAAEEHKKASAEALTVAQAAEKEAEASLATEKKDLARHAPEMLKAQKALDGAKDHLSEFRDAVAKFTELRERSTPLPEPEEVVEEAPAAASPARPAASPAKAAAEAVVEA